MVQVKREEKLSTIIRLRIMHAVFRRISMFYLYVENNSLFKLHRKVIVNENLSEVTDEVTIKFSFR